MTEAHAAEERFEVLFESTADAHVLFDGQRIELGFRHEAAQRR